MGARRRADVCEYRTCRRGRLRPLPARIDGVVHRRRAVEETFLTRLNVINYDGSVGGNVRVPIGGLTTLGADAKSWGYGLTVLWRPPVDLGEKWSYAMSATIPILTMDVSANVLVAGAGGGQIAVKRSDTQSGPRRHRADTG